ncbi:MAG: hypothetical protein WDA22_12660 [Bacteroidota bacterium]
MLNKGDELFRAQDYISAMVVYSAHAKAYPNDVEAYWRLARAAICAGDVTPIDEQGKYYRKALDASTEAVRLDSLHSDTQCWYAVSMGYIALTEGSKKKVELCHSIQKALTISITVNPRNDVAYSVYGTFYRALGNIGWVEQQLATLLLGGLPKGGYADAEQMLLKAIELAPNILRHRYELGLLYFDWGKEEKGKEVFRSALLLPQTLASDKHRIEDMKQKLLL